ncbi:ABC transporter permease [Cellulomonas carbonis]|uniref:Autoinducer 2 import system permease protein LsrD n=1 Tax=Cellulomonas carbonis T26 TaxID=947969 RepID=A0A0A0BT21_9CELL|nr:ABC transporter permease [Cellulomonas carbonis]KGM10817.1 branched-chain amino acid ABC transporter permease [Cellulomonas carbonis T26]GGC15973.1 ABC transporter permease [Cellulomonas carbonis]
MTLVRRYSSELLLVVLIVLAALWSSTLSPYFLNAVNLLSSAQFFVIFALMAFGLFPIVVQGEIDISLASTLAVGSVLFATLSVEGVPLAAALPVVLAVTAALGAVNGLLVAYAGLPSLAVTLGTLGAYRGLAYLLAGDAGVTGITPEYLLLGSSWIGIVPSSVVLALVVAALFAVLMGTTSFGRYSYAIGSSPGASRMAAVPVRRTRVIAYALAGAMAGLAGLVWVSQYQSARGDNADGSILFVLTAVVLGGVSIKGGSGRALGVLLATVLLGTIQTGMKLANVPGTSQTLVIGALLILAIGLPQAVHLVRRRFPTALPRRAVTSGNA